MKSNLFKIIFVVSLVYLAAMYILGKNKMDSTRSAGIRSNSLTTSSDSAPSATIVSSPTPMDSAPSTGSGLSSLTTSQDSTPSTGSGLSSLTVIPSAQPTPVVPPATSSEVNGFIDRFSAQYGVDPNILRHIAICESGFRSNAKNGPYLGLYQFGEITWKNIRKEFGEDTNPDLRYSAEESVQTAAYALSHGKGGIWPNCQP